jgi:hypothetical protein
MDFDTISRDFSYQLYGQSIVRDFVHVYMEGSALWDFIRDFVIMWQSYGQV